jgi:ribosomal peptide maturation radical SAM protein 1
MAARSIQLGKRADTSAPDALPVRVALVNVPFAHSDRPSIQCGVLKACLTRAGHDVDVHYLNLETARELGPERYSSLATSRSDQFVGEWLFTAAAFGYTPDEEAYRKACPGIDATCDHLGADFAELCRLRREVMPELVESWAREIDWDRYAVVGFTSTFEQNVAALALARRIKERHPQVLTVFGGANVDGDMGPEFARVFPWIDFAVSGEGDEVFPELVGCIARGESGVGLPGVAVRTGDGVVTGPPARQVSRMDELPDPDFDDYFRALFRIGRESVLGDAPPRLLFESSRGCWWGQKHHCTFCGLNNLGMTFRSKSPQRVLDELGRLSGRYSITNFEAVDNIIDMGYLEHVCGQLVERRLDYTMFYEVKANLSRAQLQTLARAGIRRIQPGIESLNTHILSLMRKGTTMLRNVRLLKWAMYYGIHVGWNILTGFPGETVQDYVAQERLVPLLRHLPPPVGCGPIWLERFSPYFFDPDLAFRNRRPQRAYDYVYPVPELDLSAIAYFFEYEAEDVVGEQATARLGELVADWQRPWSVGSPPTLVYRRAPDWIQIVDLRRDDAPAVHALHGVDAAVYEACGDTDRTADRVVRELQGTAWGGVGVDVVEEALEKFCALGLAVQEDGHVLSLALPANPNW